jgi:hypothetical protein
VHIGPLAIVASGSVLAMNPNNKVAARKILATLFRWTRCLTARISDAEILSPLTRTGKDQSSHSSIIFFDWVWQIAS